MFKKSYCAPVQPNETLADAVAKNGKVTTMPSGLSNANEPSERVIELAEQIMNISFIEAAQLSTLSLIFTSFSLLPSLLSYKSTSISPRVAV